MPKGDNTFTCLKCGFTFDSEVVDQDEHFNNCYNIYEMEFTDVDEQSIPNPVNVAIQSSTQNIRVEEPLQTETSSSRTVDGAESGDAMSISYSDNYDCDYDDGFESNNDPKDLPDNTTGTDATNTANDKEADADDEEVESGDENLSEFNDEPSDSEEELSQAEVVASKNTQSNIFDFTSINYEYDLDSIDIKKSFVSYLRLRAGGTSLKAMDKNWSDINVVQEREVSDFWSVYRLRSYITDKYPPKAKVYHICVDACYLFNDYVYIQCLVCKKPRYLNGKAQRTITVLPVIPQLAVFMYDEVTRNLMSYRSDPDSFMVVYDSDTDCSWVGEEPFTATGNTTGPYKMSDYIHCPEYLDSKDQLYQSDFDISLGCFTDGFQAFKGSAASMTIVHLVNLNMSPMARKELKNMIQFAIIPGGPKNQDIHSFLDPMLDELADAQQNPVYVKLRDGTTISFKVHLQYLGGDIPALAKVCGHAGHQFRYGCRSCVLLAEYRDGVMTFLPGGLSVPAKKRNTSDGPANEQDDVEAEQDDALTEDADPIVEQEDDEMQDARETEGYIITPFAPFRTSESYKSAVVDSLPVNNVARFEQSVGCPFADRLVSYSGFTFFALDQMHLLMNMCKRIWGIIRGDYRPKVNKRRVPFITTNQQKAIGNLMTKSMKYKPSYFPGECDTMSNAGNMRCIDWIHFGRYILPTIVVEFLEPQHRDAFLAIATVISLLCQNTVTTETPSMIDENLNIWYKWLVNPANNLKLSVFSINHHHLDHTPIYLSVKGPMHYYSAWNMERAIREYKSNIKSTRHPYANAENLLVEFAAERRYKRLNPDLVTSSEVAYDEGQVPKKTEQSLPGSSETLQAWSPFRCLKVKDVKCGVRGSHFSKLLREFLEKRDPGAAAYLLSVNYDVLIDVSARLWKKEKFIVGCSYMRGNKTKVDYAVKFSTKVVTSGQRNRVQRQRKVFFGEVHFFFTYYYNDKPHLLALLDVYPVTASSGKELYHHIDGSATPKPFIIKATDITNIVGYACGENGKKYIFYEIDHQERKTEKLGNLRDLF